ncbi:MAG: haloacid dehalogenase-like hydrolase [Fuerstiella sp.]|nr:haloacid dehalogenase-like hydrolase [Fuerstiella sp.]
MLQRVVFFDIDGTLLASGGAGQKAMENALVEEFRINVPFEGVLTAGRTDYGIVTEIFDRYQIAHSREQHERFRNAYLERLPDCLQSLSGQILPGVAELLVALSSNEDLVLALLTGNYSEGAWIKLRHFQLDQYFKFGGFGDIHADRNSVADSARATAESVLGRSIPGRHCCVVGDTPADIECARSIGAVAVAVATGTVDIEELAANNPDHLFADFSNLNRAIDRIAAISRS